MRYYRLTPWTTQPLDLCTVNFVYIARPPTISRRSGFHKSPGKNFKLKNLLVIHLYKKRCTIEMSYSTLYSRLTWADLSPTPPESPIVSSDLSSHITRTNKSIDGRPRSFHRRYRASSDTLLFFSIYFLGFESS